MDQSGTVVVEEWTNQGLLWWRSEPIRDCYGGGVNQSGTVVVEEWTNQGIRNQSTVIWGWLELLTAITANQSMPGHCPLGKAADLERVSDFLTGPV